MKISWTWSLGLALVVLATQLLAWPAQAGLFQMDFSTLENFDDMDWDTFEDFFFADELEFPLTDWSGGGDDDVTLFVMDEVDGFGDGFTGNNPDTQGEEFEYDGVVVPAAVNDDYLYRTPDTAGTSARFRFSNLDPGQYNVTVFEGRPTDGNGQFAKIWVESDPEGGGEPDDQNTGDFAHGFSTMPVTIHAGDFLWYTHLEDNSGGISGMIVRQTAGGGGAALQAGDADRDLDFDQLDLVQVQIAAKYLTGSPATWGEGDWNGAPGGSVDAPPAGDGLFNQLDIIAALGPAHYLTGKYAAITGGGSPGDEQTSVGYNPATGEVFVDARTGTELTSINIDSAAGIFTGDAAQNLGGSFDNDADNNIFKATFGGSFGTISFGNVAQVGLSEELVLGDLTVVGSLAGGGDLGAVDLIYVPEPAAAVLLLLGVMGSIGWHRRRVPV